MTDQNKMISIIVPCFNEEEALPFFYEEISKVLDEIKEDYELILVDDGSKDKTLSVMKELSSKDEHVVYLSFSRNFGKESAMYAGLCNAKGDYVGFIDADLQHPPVLLKQMIDVLNNNDYDCAACRRVDRTGDSKIRTWFARKFYKIINKISDSQMVDGAGDYRLMKRNMVDAILSLSEHNRFSKGLFGWVGFNTYWIDYENVDRVAGTSSWKFWGLVKYAIDGILSFSNTPLNISFWLGLLMSVVSVILLVISLVRVNTTITIVGVVLLVGGIQLCSTGMMGQYIGRIYVEEKDRPHYIVSKTNKNDSINIK